MAEKKLLIDDDNITNNNISDQEKQVLSYMISNYKIMLLQLGLKLASGNELDDIKIGVKRALKLLNEPFWAEEIFVDKEK